MDETASDAVILLRRPAALLVALSLLGAPAGAVAQTGPSVLVEPAAQSVPVGGDAFEARIMVEDVTDAQGLGGYALAMTYDPSVVRALSITDGGLVSSTGNSVLCPVSTIDNEAGELAHVCFTIPLFAGPGPQVTEPKLLVTVRFEPAGAGTTTLDISETSLIDVPGNDLGAATSNGTVTVDGPGGPAPTEDEQTVSVEDEPSAGAASATGEEAPSSAGDGASPVLEPALPVLGIGEADGPALRAWWPMLGLLGCAALLGGTLALRRKVT